MSRRSGSTTPPQGNFLAGGPRSSKDSDGCQDLAELHATSGGDGVDKAASTFFSSRGVDIEEAPPEQKDLVVRLLEQIRKETQRNAQDMSLELADSDALTQKMIFEEFQRLHERLNEMDRSQHNRPSPGGRPAQPQPQPQPQPKPKPSREPQPPPPRKPGGGGGGGSSSTEDSTAPSVVVYPSPSPAIRSGVSPLDSVTQRRRQFNSRKVSPQGRMIVKLAHQCRLRPANAETTQKLWQYVRELPDPNEDLSPNLDTPLAAMISMEGKLALELMQELLARGADPGRTDAVLSSPLHKAVELQSTDKVQVLLSAGANPLAVDHRSQNPLHLACTAEDIEVARLLVDAAPEAVLQEDSFGCTPVNLLEDRCLDSIPTEMLELMNQAQRKLDP